MDRIQYALNSLAGVCDGYLSKEGGALGRQRLQEVTDYINALTDERDALLETVLALNETNSQLAHQLWCLENPE